MRWFHYVISILLVSISFAQTNQKTLHSDQIAAVVDTCISAFKENYIYPDKVNKIEVYVRKKLTSGDYNNFVNLAQLTKQLRSDFRHVTKDRHIWIDIMANLPVKDAGVSLSQVVEKKRKTNFGFTRFEYLPHNTAYLKVDNFNDTTHALPIAMHSMGLLANSDHIIIDLTENHGGYGNMVHVLSSYFFKERTQLTSLYFRHTDSMATAWTEPSLPGITYYPQKLYLLVSENTASAAESFAYTMQNYKRAVIIGEATRGAAHWTESFQYKELDIFMEIPVARPINPVTQKGWEGTGILPDFKVPSGDALDKALQLIKDNLQLME